MKCILLLFIPLTALSIEPEVGIKFEGSSITLTPEGKNNREWIFESSKNLKDWNHMTGMMPVFSGETSSASKNLIDSWKFLEPLEPRGFMTQGA